MKILLLCLNLLALALPLWADPQEDKNMRWVTLGYTIEKDDATDFEAKLKKDPDNLKYHSVLLLYYSRQLFEDFSSQSGAGTEHAKQLNWFLEHDPASGILESASYPFPSMQKELYASESKAWEEALVKFPDKAGVVANAAHFYKQGDKEKALALFGKAEALDPKNPQWNLEQGHLLSDGSKESSAKALAQYELGAKKAESLPGEDWEGRWLQPAAQAALRAEELPKAGLYAERLLVHPGAGNAYDAHNILGQLALKQKDVDAAKKHLTAMGGGPGTPVGMSFGPDLELADALLKAGEKAVVIDFLGQISSSWKSEKPKDWIAQIQAGKTPTLDRNARGDSKLIQAGQKAPDFSLQDIDGKTVTLSEKLKTGPVILDFWATWCGPCRLSAPLLEKAVAKANENNPKPIQVLSIDSGEKAETVRSFLGEKSKQASYQFLLDSSHSTGKLYGSEALPTFVFIGKDGIVREAYVGLYPANAYMKSALLLAGKAYPPPLVPLKAPYVAADFNGNVRSLADGGTLEVYDSCEPKTLSTLTSGAAANGADKSAYLHWDLILKDKAAGCGDAPWAWTTFTLPDNARNLTACAGVRFWARASKPGLQFYFNLRNGDAGCDRKANEAESIFTAPGTWTQISLPFSGFKSKPELNCPLRYEGVSWVNILVGGQPMEATLDLDQLEFY
jgi:thiol-disulfide isomerase/thioredoxin